MNMQELGEAIRVRRKEVGVSQRLLADLAGMSVNTITKVERGEGNPSLSVLLLLLDTLGLQLGVSVKLSVKQ